MAGLQNPLLSASELWDHLFGWCLLSGPPVPL